MLACALKTARRENLPAHRSRVGRSRATNAEGTRAKRLRLRIGTSSCKDGRFLQVDPVIGNPASSQSLNPYSYIGNNPLSGIDPTGYECSTMTGSHIPGHDTGAAGGMTTCTGTLSQTNQKTGETTSTPVNVGISAGRIVSITRSGADVMTPAGAQSTPKNGDASSIGAQGQTIEQRPPLAGPPSSFVDGVMQRFGNLAQSGKFNTDEQQNDYVSALATSYLQGGDAGLADFARHDSPVSGTMGAMTMLAGGFAGSAQQLGTVTVTASAQDIIAANAQRIANGGFDAWRGFLSRAEVRAFERNPGVRSMLAGQAVHRGTFQALESQFPKRFDYFTKGPDFLDKSTGELIELTTPGQVGAHMARPGYGAMTYSTYTLPPLQ